MAIGNGPRVVQATGAMTLFCVASWKVLDLELGLSLHDPKRAAILRSVAVIFNNACKDRYIWRHAATASHYR